MPKLLLLKPSSRAFCLAFCWIWLATAGFAQTVFLNFNTPGQYTNNFNPWNDNGGGNGANYSFTESTNDGVGGSGGVSVFQSSDMTATYNGGGWNLATNGATVFVSLLVYADGQSSGDKVQLGLVNSTTNGLNSNPNVAFESMRFIPNSATSWSLYEQFRTNNTTVSSAALGNVTVTVNHWYKFLVAVTNTSAATGNLVAGCTLLDYGADGLTPGTNLITFAATVSHPVQNLASNTTVWPALRAFTDAGISAWDNFLVFQPASPPVLTLTLTNQVLTSGSTATFQALADGPGPISYAWYTNNQPVAGAFGAAYTTPPVEPGLTNVTVVAANANGTATNTATVSVIVPAPPQIASVPATNLQTTSATLGGQLLVTGNLATTVTLYYGPTDGGTNAGSWANAVALGTESGSFALPVAGLTPNQAYFFTVSAANSAGVGWAVPSQSFSTPPITLPQITTAPATAIGSTVATLNGQVLASGGVPVSVLLYYGPVDGGTNVAAWSNSVPLGVETGGFSQAVGGLMTNTTYYFTALAANSAGSTWATPSLAFTTLAASPATTLAAVLTYHNDNTRMGVNPNEVLLTPANVKTNTFGQLFTYAVDGFVYAQPLVVPGVNLPGKGLHNVVYVATEHNSVYAFDADSNQGSNAAPLWQTSFLGPGVTTVPNGDVGTSDITPEIGITSTPVIDPVTGTIYLEVKTKEPGPVYVHRLHALDITTGLERTNFNSPVVIATTNYPGVGSGDNDGKNPSHVLWNPLREHSRPALTLLNGQIYMSFASHGDNTPYHGWLLAYNATNVAVQTGVYNATPNGTEGGFWEGGGGPSVDAQGNLYLQSGNGTFDGGATVTTTNDYAMSIMKFSTTNGLKFVDYFAPSNAVALSDGDQDLGSSSPLILPDSAGSAAHPHLVVGGGKTSPVYVADRDNLGRFNGTAGANKLVQQFNGGPNGDRDTSPAFFNQALYLIDSNNRIGAYSISNAVFNLTPVETPDTYDNKGGATACISANGTNNAIVWALYNSGADSPTTPCILRAYNATNLAQELYSSDQLPARDSAGDAVKFTVPTIANGKVYVGAQYTLTVYGLASNYVSAPLISPGGGVFTNSVTVSLSDVAGVTIYYTLDGSLPSMGSSLYTGPFAVTNSGTVTAVGFAPGAVPSQPASAVFLNSSAIGTGTGLLGQYWANTTSAAFLAAGFAAAPTLTRVDPTVNFNWNSTNPAPNIGPDTYVVQWSGTVVPQFNETYTFSTTTDDGVLLWVNGQLLVNEWVDQSPTTWSGSITLQAQQRYNIVMDYYQNGGGAVAQLFWSSPSTGPMTIIPQSQLYPVTNSPPAVVLTAPANGTVLTAAASVTLTATAADAANAITNVAFYINGQVLGATTNPPYALTATGLGAGSYTLKAVVSDAAGLVATSTPVNLTVQAASGAPYGLTNAVPAPAFYNLPTTFAGSLPAQLSLTGVFTNTPAMTPVASLIPYSPNVPLWSDGAQKLRYFSLPTTGAPLSPATQIGYAPTNTWSFPAGTVFVKTFELQTNQSDPTSLRRLETRLLVRDVNGAVYGVTYKWRPDNSDADLLTASLTEAIPIITPAGVITQNWYYPSPADCLQCHTAVANYVLGVNARQLNGSQTYPNGVTDNQLRALNRAGLLYPAINEASIPNIESLAAVGNTNVAFVTRARSYLDANCAQCHQPGGSGPTFDARYDTPLNSQNLLNTPAVKGQLGYDNVYIVTPKDVWRSSLYDRMNVVNPAVQMPPLARNLIDTNAVQLMADWINSRGGTPALPPPVITPASGLYQQSLNVSIQSPTNPVALYYTLDRSLPTTNSFLYAGAFQLTNSATVNANAWAPGYINSVVGAAQFTLAPGIYFTSAGGFTNGLFSMSFGGPAGSNYILQVSSDLVHWTSLSTNTPLNSPFGLSDPRTPASPAQFYRIIQEP